MLDEPIDIKTINRQTTDAESVGKQTRSVSVGGVLQTRGGSTLRSDAPPSDRKSLYDVEALQT